MNAKHFQGGHDKVLSLRPTLLAPGDFELPRTGDLVMHLFQILGARLPSRYSLSWPHAAFRTQSSPYSLTG